jgi:predicted solute-binding protein
MVSWKLPQTGELRPPPQVSAVSYLNTVPLVWGFLRGCPSRPVALDFCVPSECARRVESGAADLGIVPVVEMQRQGLLAIPGAGIACQGAVRSILLVSDRSPDEIRTLAVDSGSRTSVMLARVILKHRYRCEPEIAVMDPDLERMLGAADAALLIGDAALRLDPETLRGHVLDLGAEWRAMTGLPMVFALWAGKRERVAPLLDAGYEAAFRESLDFGLREMNTIVEEESRRRGFSETLVRQYLTRHIAFRIEGPELEGMQRFLQYVHELEALPVV